MTDRERKSLVVRRLEQLFTGRDYIADILKTPLVRPGGSFIRMGNVTDEQVTDQLPVYELPTDRHEPIREARILPPEQQFHTWGNNCHSSNSVLPFDPSKDSIKTGGNDEDSVSGTKSSPPLLLLPKQQATRPCDLDPDRAQVPYENMNYIRHLDLLPPELLPRRQSSQGVDLDAEGWVSLNLLYNLAQLHLNNMTTEFVAQPYLKTAPDFSYLLTDIEFYGKAGPRIPSSVATALATTHQKLILSVMSISQKRDGSAIK